MACLLRTLTCVGMFVTACSCKLVFQTTWPHAGMQLRAAGPSTSSLIDLRWHVYDGLLVQACLTGMLASRGYAVTCCLRRLPAMPACVLARLPQVPNYICLIPVVHHHNHLVLRCGLCALGICEDQVAHVSVVPLVRVVVTCQDMFYMSCLLKT